jgi:tetratricopeptide (TPR) repeat protein
VYEARDPDLGRRVAIKILRDGTVDRLQMEATAAARLQHPNIVAVHEVGPDYIVMDYIDGRTLAEARPTLSLPERVRVLETVARAVEHAHSKGVVHRDLKPANIILEPGGRVVLTDFGIAKLLDGEDLTITGSVMGTPHYMAPEQVQGKGFGPSVDIWALGVLLYDAVSGRHPFEGDSALDIYDRIVRREPTRLRGPLGAIAAKALEKDPARRYGSAQAIADDLARHARGERLSITTSQLGAQLRRLLPRAAIVTAVIAAGLGLYAQHRTALTAAREAERPAEAKEVDKFTAREAAATRILAQKPNDVPTLLDRSRSRQRRGDLARDHGQNPLAFYAAAIEDADRAIALDAQSTLAWQQRSRVLTQRAVYKSRYGIDPLPDLEAAEADLEPTMTAVERRPLLGNLRFLRALWLQRQGGNGRHLLEEAEAYLTPAADLEIFLRRGRVRAALGKFDEADRDFAIALDMDPKSGWGWTRRGEARLMAGDLEGARRYLDQSARVDLQRADTYEIRGHVHFARGDFAAALSDYQQAITRNAALAPVLAERMDKARTSAGR